LPESRVLDPMCGSGTTLAVAARLGRRWAGIDASQVAWRIASERLASLSEQPILSGAPQAQARSKTPVTNAS
jgi:DNA modification methylase